MSVPAVRAFGPGRCFPVAARSVPGVQSVRSSVRVVRAGRARREGCAGRRGGTSGSRGSGGSRNAVGSMCYAPVASAMCVLCVLLWCLWCGAGGVAHDAWPVPLRCVRATAGRAFHPCPVLGTGRETVRHGLRHRVPAVVHQSRRGRSSRIGHSRRWAGSAGPRVPAGPADPPLRPVDPVLPSPPTGEGRQVRPVPQNRTDRPYGHVRPGGKARRASPGADPAGPGRGPSRPAAAPLPVAPPAGRWCGRYRCRPGACDAVAAVGIHLADTVVNAT